MERLSYSEREAVLPANRNVNQTPYLNKQSRHRANSHSESNIPLLDPNSTGKGASAVYMHYRSSLVSLGDIIDRVSTVHFV